MNPVAFEIGSRPIYWYGIMVALGFIAAMFHWTRLARRSGLAPELGADLAMWTLVGGVAGARLAYVAAHASHYLAHPVEILRVDQGGLIFYGGLLGGMLAVAWLGRRRKLPAGRFADYAITGVPLGHAFGRVGCFLNACCYGAPTSGPLGFHAAGAHRHPVQLYEATLNVLLYLALLRYHGRRGRSGRVLALYLAGYGTIRFGLEFLRGDERAEWLGFVVAQEISLALVAAGGVLWGLLSARGAGGKATADAETNGTRG